MIGGVIKHSFIDYPGKTACVVFLSGCNLACPYCHNPELVLERELGDAPSEEGVLKYLSLRKPLINGVAISGGEPTLHGHRLIEFCRTIKTAGFPVKIDTNGTRPQVLEALIAASAVDYIAMDIKTDPVRYPEIAKSPAAMPDLPDRINKSIRRVITSGLPHEFRTTCVHPLVDEAAARAIGDLLGGADRLVLQACRNHKVLFPARFAAEYRPMSAAEMEGIRRLMDPGGRRSILRTAKSPPLRPPVASRRNGASVRG
jgi:pyruvate formate lyase activating enzyme